MEEIIESASQLACYFNTMLIPFHILYTWWIYLPELVSGVFF